MNLGLKDKVVLVTGASRGLGAAIAVAALLNVGMKFRVGAIHELPLL